MLEIRHDVVTQNHCSYVRKISLINYSLLKNTMTIIAMLLCFSAFSQGQLQKEAAGTIDFASGKIMQLAEAVPEDKYSWTPQEGVRSFKDVLTHIISANYFFASKMGAQIPEDVNMQTVEQDLKTKAEVTAALKQSYDVIIKAVENTKDEALPIKVEYPFPGEFTNMSSILIGISHTHEHLGQLIAYARMNDVKPPWSQGAD